MAQQETADVVIIGGGIIGLVTARALARSGVGRVILLERNELGAEASHAAGGMLAPQAEADEAGDFFAFACANRDAYPAFAAQLLEETEIDCELDQTGTLYLALNEHDEAEITRRHQWQQTAGLKVSYLDGNAARKLEPGIAPKIRAALYFPLDWQIDNRLLCKALARSCQQLGVDLRPGAQAREILLDGDKISGVATKHENICAPNVVIAAGAWSGLLPAGLAPQFAVAPVRGQMLCFQGEKGLVRHVVYSPRGYLVPRRDGRILTGSTTENAGFDKKLTLEGLNQITRQALEIAPDLGRLPWREAWAGLRPRAADGLPVIGPDPQIAGLFHATGHYRNGILLAPLTGALLAETITGGESALSLGPFSPARFANRNAANYL
jgi:glycine oxidase